MFKINERVIGKGHPTFFIAEGGLNHNGDINIAKKLVDEAKNCGVDAIKFQTFKTESFVSKSNQYFDVFKNAELSYNEFLELKSYSEKKEIIFFSAPFDLESASFLNEIDIPCFKIASSDLTNFPLIEHIAKMNKPIILSTGSATMDETEEAVNCCLKNGNNQLAILHCVANYPAKPEEVNLNVIQSMNSKFEFPIGYSDNGDSNLVDLVATSVGATIIEKHFTLDKKMDGPDHSFSIEPSSLRDLILQIREVEAIRGNGLKYPTKWEIEGKVALRKSIVSNQDFKAGDEITENSISIKRPATGIAPKYFKEIIGKKLKNDLSNDTPIMWEDLD